MKMTEDKGEARYIINAYAPGQVTVNHHAYSNSLIVSPEQLVTDWRPRTVAELENGDIEAILACEPEVVLLGTGERQQFPPPAFLRHFALSGIGCEVMDNAAACRTYTVLMAERRRVVAALLCGV